MAVLYPQLNNVNTIPNFFSAPYVSGLQIVRESNTVFSVKPGCARSYTSSYNLMRPQGQLIGPSNFTVDTSTVGPLGCYPLPASSFVADTLLPVYFLCDSAGASNSNPPTVIVGTGDNFILTGYNEFRKIGYIWMLAGGTISQFQQIGSLNSRTYFLDQPVQVLTSGTSTTYAPVDLSLVGPVPSTATKVYLAAAYTGAAAGDIASISLDIGGSPLAYAVQAPVVGVIGAASLCIAASNQIYYQVMTGGSLDLAVVGFEDELNLNTL